MGMRLLGLALVLMIALIQNPLWFGKGGLLRVRELSAQVEAQKETNLKLAARNAVLDAEVLDLKQGYDAIEERARSELGMVKQDEVFFQVLQPARAPAAYAPDKR
ncbi:MAG TPA: cell division protein FtsB [Burkholderiales bacterium]|nr:cell division protein FtsB [Burkholderiales bacterium]